MRGIVSEINLSNKSRAIEQEREPADPGPELDVADCLDPWRERNGGVEDLADDLEKSVSRIIVIAGYQDSFCYCPGCNPYCSY